MLSQRLKRSLISISTSIENALSDRLLDLLSLFHSKANEYHISSSTTIHKYLMEDSAIMQQQIKKELHAGLASKINLTIDI